MSAKVFNSLKKSIGEAGAILRGEIVDYRSFTFDKPATRDSRTALAVFVGDDEDFIVGKIYEIKYFSDQGILATSETDEAVVLEPGDFMIVKFQPKAEKRLRQLITAHV